MAPTYPTTRQARWAAAPVTDEAAFLAALPVIDDITSQVCRRHHLRTDEADDLRSEVRMHFIERNYEVLRRFEGRASLPTYVKVIVQRLFLDFRNRRWGRWRPSTEAQRLGPTAILLERLITRDGWSREQAVETVRVNGGGAVDTATLAFCDKLTRRIPARRFVPEEDARDVPTTEPSPDTSVVRAEREFLAKRVMASLARARQSLHAMDRLILKMRFEQRMPVVEIARALNLEQRPLYRTFDRIADVLRTRMMADGVDKADIEALLTDSETAWIDALGDVETTEAAPLTPAAEGGRSSWQRD